ncbi:MAG: ribonuclease HI family protein [Patescibacteria group bacterium]|jgi:ribonuclease HI
MITVYTDGASSGNPGPGWAMYVIEIRNSKSETRNIQNRVRLEHCTNNEAEYLAVIYALEYLSNKSNESYKTHESNPSEPISFLLDSKLVVEQLNGRWKVKEARMREFILQIHTLLNELKIPVTFTYIPREKNKADQLKYD